MRGYRADQLRPLTAHSPDGEVHARLTQGFSRESAQQGLCSYTRYRPHSRPSALNARHRASLLSVPKALTRGPCPKAFPTLGRAAKGPGTKPKGSKALSRIPERPHLEETTFKSSKEAF